jgi:hypothetical protein
MEDKEHVDNALSHVNAAYEELNCVNRNAFKLISPCVLTRIQCDMDRLLGKLEVVSSLADGDPDKEDPDG